jgi:hypothetical protein
VFLAVFAARPVSYSKASSYDLRIALSGMP